jgi:hypothetical protein
MRFFRANGGRRTRLVRVSVSTLLMMACGTLSAQAPSDSAVADTNPRGTLPFRAGQWGAEVRVFSDAGAGLLRFTAPNRAWILDFAITAEAGNVTDPDGTTHDTRTVFARSRVGLRTYRPLIRSTGSTSARAAAFTAFGGSVDGFWRSDERFLGSRQGSFGLGAFIEAGGSAFVTDYLALSASVEAVIGGRYDVWTTPSPGGGRDKRVSRDIFASLGSIRLFASVFF